MKLKFLASILFTCALVALPATQGGCASQPGQPQAMTDADVHDGVQDAVVAYVLLGKDHADERADRVRNVATQVLTTVDANVNVDPIALAADFILKQSDESSRAAANVLVNAIVSQVRRRMGVNPDVVTLPPEQFTEARRLIKLAAQSALESVAMVQKK